MPETNKVAHIWKEIALGIVSLLGIASLAIVNIHLAMINEKIESGDKIINERIESTKNECNDKIVDIKEELKGVVYNVDRRVNRLESRVNTLHDK